MARELNPVRALEDVLRLQKRIVLPRQNPNGLTVIIPACDIECLPSVSSPDGVQHVTIEEFRRNSDLIVDTVHLGSVVITADQRPVAAVLSQADFKTLRHCDAQEVPLNLDDVANNDRPNPLAARETKKPSVH